MALDKADPTEGGHSPSVNLLANLRRELAVHAPFAQMAPEHVERFVSAARMSYFAPDELILEPGSGAVQHLYCVRQGAVVGSKGLAEAAGGFRYEAGDLFPVGAALGERAVTATYRSEADTFCLALPVAQMRALAAVSPPFADFLQRRVMQLLDISRRAVQAGFASQSLAEQSLEAPLGALTRRTPLAVRRHTPLGDALRLMHERGVGSVLVSTTDGAPEGILTRHDVLGRITLPQVSLETPIERVMSHPIRSLSTLDTAQDAMLLMSRHGIRHVPVVEAGRAVSIVSERDLFALQRLSLKHVSGAIRAAEDLPALKTAAADIRRLARNLLGQGVHARQMTELISHLNDLLAERWVTQVAARRGLDVQQVCWLAFGSEGRGEQTIATDQDNGLIFVSEQPEAERSAWLAFGREVNEGLDACGYPLCQGNVMASNPDCCLTQTEWLNRLDDWIDRGAPQDLLNASIYFDMRAVAGQTALIEALRQRITERASAVPRFIKQLATNALVHRPPLTWRGTVDTQSLQGHQVIDLKLQGTAIFVDTARIYALAHGIAATGTRARLQAVGAAIGASSQESEAWITGFEFLQTLRLRVQIALHDDTREPATFDNPNLVAVDQLNEIDRRVLRESLRMARQLQQRLEMDYQR